MASDEESPALDTHHTEKEWEEQRENFRICYLEDNLTRKEAADHMKDNHNFNATPRQWERKIKQWGFSKYTNRDERLTQIHQAGKTVVDVSRPGRRPRSLVDEYGNLQPHVEDRNLRRFARREVSRSRSRSRSTSFTERQRPHFKQEFSEPLVNTATAPGFNFNDIGSERRRTVSGNEPHLSEMQAARERSQPLQDEFFQNQGATSYGMNDDSVAASSQSHWNPHASPPLHAPLQNQFEPFPNIPMPLHTLQGIGYQNASQPFSENVANLPFNYSLPDPPMQPLPTAFDQFDMSGNQIAMQPSMMPENFMTEQAMFDNAIQLPGGPDVLDSTGFDGNPTFAIVDMDSPEMRSVAGTAALQSLPSIPVQTLGQTLPDNGPLGNDVVPLVEQYTRAVQMIALGAVSDMSHPDGISRKLAEDLVQPRNAFMVSMSIVLENFAKTQQRSLQSMKDTCSKLRQKNAMLEQILNGTPQIDPSSIEHQPHQSSVPPQTMMYGDMYGQNY